MKNRRGIRGKSFLDTSLKIVGIEHILELTMKPISYSRIWERSQIKYKKSFLNYLNYCIEKRLVNRTHINDNDITRGAVYKTSHDGKRFLQIIA